MGDKDVITVSDLPLFFIVKYLGKHPAKGIWGMKHTRKPVDTLVSQAKNLPSDVILPIVKMEISEAGMTFVEITNQKLKYTPNQYSIDMISYGVQDLVYTRVFSMIVVLENDLENGVPFECHSFVCDSRDQARRITYALAAAFQEYGKKIKAETGSSERPIKKFAIDLRTPEEQAEASDGETDA